MIGWLKREEKDGGQLTGWGGRWRSFRKFIPGEQARATQAAYNHVFRLGNASSEEREMVLIDLAQKSGFYRVTPPSGAENAAYELGVANGKREMFGHIYNILRLSAKEKSDLETGVRTDWMMIANSEDPTIRTQY